MTFGRGTGEILSKHLNANLIGLKKGLPYSDSALDDLITKTLNGTDSSASVAPIVPAPAPTKPEEQKVAPVVKPEAIKEDIIPVKAPTLNREVRFPVREQKPSTEDLIRGSSRKQSSDDSFTLGETRLNIKEKSSAKFW
jgi:hypothetical protein